MNILKMFESSNLFKITFSESFEGASTTKESRGVRRSRRPHRLKLHKGMKANVSSQLQKTMLLGMTSEDLAFELWYHNNSYLYTFAAYF